MKEDTRPHIVKEKHFLKIFPHRLESNEWKVKWPIRTKFGKTYNPDFWCPDLNCFIELVTSSNVSSRRRWIKAVRMGYPLRVFWWEGGEMTPKFKAKDNQSKGARL